MIYPRGSFYHIAANIGSSVSCTAAEIGVADTENVKTWVAGPNSKNLYMKFKEIVLVDNTQNSSHLQCINLFTVNNPFSKFLNMTSVEAAVKFPDEYFDFIYIDANHYYKYVSEDLNAWQYKVKRGGFIAGHDYDYHIDVNGKPQEDPGFEVNRAVDEFARSKNVQVIKLHTEFVIRRSW